MIDATQYDLRSEAARGLPAWWRCLLIAAATLILSSCRGPITAEKKSRPPVDLALRLAAAVGTPDPGTVISDVDNQPSQDGPALFDERLIPVIPILGDDEAPLAPSQDTPSSDTLSTARFSRTHAHNARHATPLSADSNCTSTGQPCADCGTVGPSDEYLCDGGDFISPAGVRADWSIDGLEQEDAIAHYDTVDGRVIVTPSNRVCIYAPRFAAVRRVVNLIAHEQPVFVDMVEDDQSLAKAAKSQPVVTSLQRHAVKIDLGQRPPSLYRQRQQAGEVVQLLATMEAYLSLAAYADLQIIRTGVIDNAEKPRLAKSIESAITLTGDQAPQVVFGVKAAHEEVGLRQPGIVYQTNGPDSPKLRLIKLASCGNAAPGDLIEFTLRFDNIGDQVIGNVTIVDNLSTRFEYVPESAKSSVDANFSTEPNDAESSILRWEIKDPVQPNTGGVLRFTVRVR